MHDRLDVHVGELLAEAFVDATAERGECVAVDGGGVGAGEEAGRIEEVRFGPPVGEPHGGVDVDRHLGLARDVVPADFGVLDGLAKQRAGRRVYPQDLLEGRIEQGIGVGQVGGREVVAGIGLGFVA